MYRFYTDKTNGSLWRVDKTTGEAWYTKYGKWYKVEESKRSLVE